MIIIIEKLCKTGQM